MSIWRIQRHDYRHPDSTIGTLSIDGEFRAYTLEDRVRLILQSGAEDTERIVGTKVYGKTAIPAGEYQIRASISQRFGRLMVEVLNVPMFVGVRMHGGNKHQDTDGCPLVAQGARYGWIGGRAVATSRELAEYLEAAVRGFDKTPQTLIVADDPVQRQRILEEIGATA